MRFPGDYLGDMPTTEVLDRDIELLLAGTPIEGGQVSVLAPVMEMIRAQWTPEPSESEIAKFASLAGSTVKGAQSAATAVTTLQRRRVAPRHGLSPRLATVGIAVLLMSGTAGMAMAADSAVPGDALYGLDRAFEAVGIGSGSSEERLDEAIVMAAQRRSGEALQHAIEALGSETGDSSEAAAAALVTAAANLVDTQDTPEAAATASSRVTALLTYIADNIGIDEGTDGREFGQGVAQLARDIGAGDGSTGAQDPTVAPAPGQGQSNDPGAGEGNDGTGPGNGNSNGNDQGSGNGNGQNSGNGSGNGPDNPSNQNGQSNGSGNGQDSGPPVESPSVSAPDRANRAPNESPSVTAPGKGNNALEESPSATAPGKGNKP